MGYARGTLPLTTHKPRDHDVPGGVGGHRKNVSSFTKWAHNETGFSGPLSRAWSFASAMPPRPPESPRPPQTPRFKGHSASGQAPEWATPHFTPPTPEARSARKLEARALILATEVRGKEEALATARKLSARRTLDSKTLELATAQQEALLSTQRRVAIASVRERDVKLEPCFVKPIQAR